MGRRNYLVEGLSGTGTDVPQDGVRVDATAPVERVVDAILSAASVTR
jgi:hypothetical protein